MKEMTKFQLVLTGVFAFFIVVGVITFALGGRGKSSSDAGDVLVWGTMPAAQFSDFLRESKISDDRSISVTYVEKKKETFDTDFIEALAAERGPDLFFLTEDSIVKHQDKIVTIPFDSYSERQFREDFIEEGELYLTSKGALALPFIVDPLVM